MMKGIPDLDIAGAMTVLREYRLRSPQGGGLSYTELLSRMLPDPGFRVAIEVNPPQNDLVLIVTDLTDGWRVFVSVVGDEQTPTLEAAAEYAKALQGDNETCAFIVQQSRSATR
jgi:hypothetical protein